MLDLLCPVCGGRLTREEKVWRCENRLRNGTRFCKDSPTLEEKVLHRAILNAINRVLENKGEFVQIFRRNVIAALTDDARDEPHYAAERKRLQQEMAKLIQQHAEQDGDEDAFETQYRAISAQMEELKVKQIREAQKAAGDGKIEEIKGFLERSECALTTYDDKLVRQLIRNIYVTSAAKIEVVFQSGIVVEEWLERD